MAPSAVYSSIFGAVLASLWSVSTRFVLFDTAVVDLTDDLHDPVDLLFGTQLGGGTDINQALGYCQQVSSRPSQTILVLITDLYEGGDSKEMLRRAAELKQSGVNVVRPERPGRPRLRPQPRPRLRKPRHPGVRVYARPLSRAHGGGDPGG